MKQRILELRSIDASQNRYRRYRIAETRSLFGEPCLLIEWGRVGSPLHFRCESFPNLAALRKRRDELTLRRRRNGYSEEWPIHARRPVQESLPLPNDELTKNQGTDSDQGSILDLPLFVK